MICRTIHSPSPRPRTNRFTPHLPFGRLLQLLQRFEQLPAGATLVIIDSQLLSRPQGFSERFLERDGARVYRMLCSAQCRASWGAASAFVYEKAL